MNRPTVVITKCYRWACYQLFLLGLYELEKDKKINLRFKAGFVYRLSTILPSNVRLFQVLLRLKRLFEKDSDLLEGYMEYNGTRKYFCIDSADAPYLFDTHNLEKVSVYFKMQCPKEIDEEKGFRLTDDVYIPYCDHAHSDKSKLFNERGSRAACYNLHDNKYKIKPLMVGFRSLSYLNSYKSLKKAYYSYKIEGSHSKKLMCYFGNALGPKPGKVTGDVDYNSEGDLMGYYASSLNHPNEKRAIVASIIANKGDNYDARVISTCQADSGGKTNKSLIIPLSDFCKHISNFEYNLNISGYRMSIPNRFIESFIVGTAILTDRLAVKWYLPFDDEVVETCEMGYLQEKDVDWSRVKHDIDNLPKVDSKRVQMAFDKKWAPKVVAQYMINTCLGTTI